MKRFIGEIQFEENTWLNSIYQNISEMGSNVIWRMLLCLAWKAQS